MASSAPGLRRLRLGSTFVYGATFIQIVQPGGLAESSRGS